MAWWRVAIKFSSNATACFWLASFFANCRCTWCNGWENVTWLRLTTIRYFLSRKKQKSVFLSKKSFCRRRSRKKKMFLDIFDHKITDDWYLAMKVGSVKEYVLWKLVKATRLLKSLIKFTYKILRECLLAYTVLLSPCF